MSTRFLTLTYLYLSSIKSCFLHTNAIPAVMTLFHTNPREIKRCLFTFLPHGLLGRQHDSFLTEPNRHVPRKNAIERIESTIGKSDLGEKAWCLKTASGSLLVMSNLEESTYRYGPHMNDAFCVS